MEYDVKLAVFVTKVNWLLDPKLPANEKWWVLGASCTSCVFRFLAGGAAAVALGVRHERNDIFRIKQAACVKYMHWYTTLYVKCVTIFFISESAIIFGWQTEYEIYTHVMLASAACCLVCVNLTFVPLPSRVQSALSVPTPAEILGSSVPSDTSPYCR